MNNTLGVGLVIAIIAITLFTGCIDKVPIPRPTPSSTPTPSPTTTTTITPSPVATPTHSPTATPTPTPSPTATPKPTQSPPTFSKHIGASYMTFWKVADLGDWTASSAHSPHIGQYSSNDSDIAALHIDSARRNGINLFYLDFGWIRPDDPMDLAAQRGLLQAYNIDQINICIFYFPDAVVGSSWSQGQKRLFSDFDYLAQHYFTHSSYLRHNGKPVVIINNLPLYQSEYGVDGTNALFQNLTDHVSKNYGEQLYLIAGIWPDSEPQFLVDSPFEAITIWGNLWASLGNDPDRTYSYSEYSNRYRQIWEYWHSIAIAEGVDFVPLIMPGFNNLAYVSSGQDHYTIQRDLNEFKSLCTYADSLVTPNFNTVLLFTWNDFNEATSIEASNEYGFSFLEAVRETIGFEPTSEKHRTEIYGQPISEPKYNIFDNGLYHRCVKTGVTPTTQEMEKHLFEDLSDCMDNDPVFGNHSWILGFHSEQDYGGKCDNYSAINAPDSPITFEWIEEEDGSLTAHLKQDYINYQHPCGKDYFNWYVFSNFNVQRNKPYPRPDVLVSEHTIRFNKNIQKGSSRLIAAMSGFRYETSERDPDKLKPFQIEIALNIDDSWWDTEPGPVISTCYPETTSGCPADFVFIDGDNWNYVVNENEETILRIEWWKVFQYLIENGWLTPPYEYNNNYLSTGSVSVGFELKNIDQTDSIMGEVYITDFKILSK